MSSMAPIGSSSLQFSSGRQGDCARLKIGLSLFLYGLGNAAATEWSREIGRVHVVLVYCPAQFSQTEPHLEGHFSNASTVRKA